MICCNLSVLLAERKLKISKVSQDTGISRTTLTSLAYGHNQGISLETINVLCTYLGVELGEFLLYAPYDFIYDIRFENIVYERNANFEVNLTEKHSGLSGTILAHLDTQESSDGRNDYRITIRGYKTDTQETNNLMQLHNILKSLNQVLLHEIEKAIVFSIDLGLGSGLPEDKYYYRVNWNNFFSQPNI